MEEGFVFFGYLGMAIFLAFVVLGLVVLGLAVRRQLRTPSTWNLLWAAVATAWVIGWAYWLWYTRFS